MLSNLHRAPLAVGVMLCMLSADLAAETGRATPDPWQRQSTDLRASGGDRIRAIHHPPGARARLRQPAEIDRTPRIRRAARAFNELPRSERLLEMRNARRKTSPNDTTTSTQDTAASTAPIHVLVIDSPPIDGFISYIAVVATDERSASLELDAIPSTTVGGTLIQPDDLEADYTVGLLDTGAGAHLVSNAAGLTFGLGSNGLLTNSTITITGVTGSVDAFVSYPIGLYIDGIDSIDPQSLLLDTTNMVGETNVSVAVADTPAPGAPELFTAIGTPLSVYYTATFNNEQTVSRTIDSEVYETPLIEFYEQDDLSIPEYPNLVPLELRPLGGVSVQYTPCIDVFGGCPLDAPQSPSIIIGVGAQSLFFLSSVDLYQGNRSAIDKDRFMLDTGAQVTVIGNRVAARLNLNPATPDFLVEIEGVSGDVTMEPGFYIDRIDIPALGEWMTFTNVPVVLLEVGSPEGGTLDGIIGMNLMTDFNFVLRGGGLFLQDDPSLEYQLIVPPAVDADFDNDNDVDLMDFAAFQRCMSGPDTPQLAPSCVHALLDADSDVDENDMAILQDCFSGPAIDAEPDCRD